MENNDREETRCEIFDKGALEGTFVKLPLLVMFDDRLNHSHLYTYALLKSFAWRGSCFPGKETLSSQGALSISSIYRYVEVLERVGLVTVERRKGMANRYVLELMADVYFKSTDPPVLKDEYVASVRKRGAVKVLERALDIRIGETDDPVEEAPVVLSKIRRVDRRSEALLGSFKSVEERAQEARERQQHNRKLRNKHNATAEKPAYADAIVEEQEKPINTNDVQAVWMDVAAQLWPNSAGLRKPWTPVEKGIVKKLIVKWSGEVVVYCVEHIMRNWEDIKSRYRVNRPLDMKLIAFHANSWFPEIQEGKKMSMLSRREKALRQGEYEQDGTATRQGGLESWLDR